MITFRTNAAQVANGLKEAAKQMPFAVALALTRTAQAAQSEVRSHLGDTFTLRNDWISKGIRVTPAKKSKLEAAVYSKDWFLALHNTGGDRVTTSTGKDAVPVGARANKRDFTRKASYPGKILANPASRGYKVNFGNGTVGIFKRKGRGKNSRTVLFWVLVRSITVRADWDFDQQINSAVARTLPSALVQAIEHAIATAKR